MAPPAGRAATAGLGDHRQPRGHQLPALGARRRTAGPGRACRHRGLARNHHHDYRALSHKTFDSAGCLVATELVLSGRDWFPIGGEGDPDPLRLILGQLDGLATDEHAVIQVIAQPTTWRQQTRLLSAARRLRAGISISPVSVLLDLLLPAPRTPSRSLDPTVSPDVRAVLEKASQPLYRCLIRIAVTAPEKAEARGRIHGVAGGFAAYEGRVGFRRRRARHARSRLESRALGRRAFLLSITELARLAHLPTDTLPNIQRAGARAVPAPTGLISAGKPLGLTGGGDSVFLGIRDSRYHLHVLGPTGVGKSTLIARLALTDLAAGRGSVVVDPKGDLVEDILARIPAGLDDRVDLLDPLDSAPPALNVLEGDDPDLVVDQLVGIFRRVFERFWGPRTDDILRASLLTLIRTDAQATLADVPRLLADDDWRQLVTGRLDDPVGLEPFWAWYDELGESMRAQATGPVLNKLRAFLLRRPVRAIVGQPTSTIHVPRVLDQGRLLLVRVPKGTLGEDTSRLLGSFVVARVWQAALARAARPEQQRPDAALYVDEVHNYLSLPTPLADMLAEARGYRLSLCLAHQHLGQLPREMRDALSANARSKLYFQLSPEDARALERLVEPDLAAHDLAHLPTYTAAARICHNGEPSRAFTLTTEPLRPGRTDRAEAVRADSRRRNGRPVAEIDADLAARQGRSIPRRVRRELQRHDTREAA